VLGQGIEAKNPRHRVSTGLPEVGPARLEPQAAGGQTRASCSGGKSRHLATSGRYHNVMRCNDLEHSLLVH